MTSLIHLVRPDCHRSMKAKIVRKLIDLKAFFKSVGLSKCRIKLLCNIIMGVLSFFLPKPQFPRIMISKGNLI